MNLSHKEKLNQVEKIHTQYGHALLDYMEKLILNANLLDNETSQLLKEVTDNCAACNNFKKPSARLIVALSKVDDFNQTLSFYLHELKHGLKLWYMHRLDDFTRYSAGAILTNKVAAGKNFMKHWIAVFGPPKTVFSDNGK